THDPVTLAVILVAVGLAFHRSASGFRPMLAGIGLYLAYIVRIGGDFMSGRFFAAPFVASVAVLTTIAAERGWPSRSGRWQAPALAVALCVLGLFGPGTRWRSGIDYGVGWSYRDAVRASGIADERAYYYPSTGLLRLAALRSRLWKEGEPFPPYRGA